MPALGDRADVRPQLPFAASDRSEPEPDLCIVEPGEHLDEHPTRCLLAIEIANGSVDYDHEKLRIYAGADVPGVWIVHLPEEAVEVYLDPANGRYRSVRTLRSDRPRSSASEPDFRATGGASATLGRGERVRAARVDLELGTDELLP